MPRELWPPWWLLGVITGMIIAQLLRCEPAPAQVALGPLVAFTSAPDGVNADVWVLDLGTGLKRRLTTSPTREDQPAWSPDGQLIAYRRGPDVWTMRPDGSGQTRRTFSPSLEWFPFWYPDGRLGYTLNKGAETTEEIYFLGPGDAPVPTGVKGRAAAVSPDGAWLCYTHFDGTVRDVRLRRLFPPDHLEVLAVNGYPTHNCAWDPLQPHRMLIHSHHRLPSEPRGNGRLWLADTTGWISGTPYTVGPPLDGNAYDPNSGDIQPTWHASGWVVWSRPVGCDPPPVRCGEQHPKRELFGRHGTGPEVRLTNNAWEDRYPSFKP